MLEEANASSHVCGACGSANIGGLRATSSAPANFIYSQVTHRNIRFGEDDQMSRSPTKKLEEMRPRIYALRTELLPNGGVRSWRKIGKLLGIHEATVRYNYKIYCRLLNIKLESQKALVVARGIEGGGALPLSFAQSVNVVHQVDHILTSLAARLEKAGNDDMVFCGISTTMMQYLKFKHNSLEDTHGVVASEEMMQVLVEVLSEENHDIRERILTRVVDRLGEGLKQLWDVSPPGAD